MERALSAVLFVAAVKSAIAPTAQSGTDSARSWPVGGDGTVAAVASRLVDTDRRLGILPLGTLNYVARGLGIPTEIPDAIRVLLEGREGRVDVGDVNGRVFLNNASLGAYAAYWPNASGSTGAGDAAGSQHIGPCCGRSANSAVP